MKTITILLASICLCLGCMAQSAGYTAIFKNHPIVQYEGQTTVSDFSLIYQSKADLNILIQKAERFAPSRKLIVSGEGENKRNCSLIFEGKVPEIAVHKMLLAWGFDKVIVNDQEMTLDEFRTRLSTEIK